MEKTTKVPESQKKAQAKYNAKAIKKMTFAFSKIYDKDVLDYLNQCGNKRNTILTALREYMKNHK